MPSLVTSKAPATSSTGKSLSRVNSFKRDWGDQGQETRPTNPLKGGSIEIPLEWSPSPDRYVQCPEYEL